ncbi:hypothetical protein ACHAXT_010325 [Thalassiosira profunda]
MSSAATAKRRMELNSGIGGRVKSRQASAGPASPPSSPEKSTNGAQNSTTARNGAGSNLSDKRRMAALISWEKRRKAAEKASKGAGGAAAAKGRSGSSVASKGRGRKAAPAPPAKRRKADNKPLSRSDAARAGWERRKRELAAQEQAREVRRQAAKEGWAKRKGQRKPKQSKTAKDVRREAAKRGWARRKSELAAKPPGRSGAKPLSRSEAARVGWERRKAQLAAAGLDSSSSEEEASESEEESDEEEPRSAPAKKAGVKRVYTANMRAEAARRGWERKKREAAAREAARRGSNGYASSASSGRSRKSSSTSRSTATAPAKPKKEAKVKYHGQKYYREGAKRSSRLAEETSTDVYEEMKKVNELVTRLRERGWMEFHPSSRLGSGTATYGYIPSTIASFIRSGYVSQGAVLENGELGIHYALDYEGYGGLKEMIDTFGEDFSPCLTDGMMDEKRVAEWELGEDLPWREVEEEENRKMRELVEAKAVLEDTSVDSDEDETVEEDILFVAGILASLDQDAVREEAAALKECSKVGAEPESATSTSNTSSPSMLALKDYESSEDGSDGCKSQESNPRSRLTDASLTREAECKTQSKLVEEEDDVLIIQSRPSLTSSWNFGIC